MAFKFSFVAVAALGVTIAGGGAWWLQSRPQGPTPVTSEGGGSASDAVAKPAAGAPGAARVAGVEVARVEAVSLRDEAQAVGSLRAR